MSSNVKTDLNTRNILYFITFTMTTEKRTTIRFPDEMWKAIEIESDERGISCMEFIRKAVQEKLDSKNNDHDQLRCEVIGILEELNVKFKKGKQGT